MATDEAKSGSNIKCGMLDVYPALDGDTQEVQCYEPSVGITEDAVQVCSRHATMMKKEGFGVTYYYQETIS